jgi:FtsP/CotA-like multicopper oxidase with cupredoxin domain
MNRRTFLAASIAGMSGLYGCAGVKSDPTQANAAPHAGTARRLIVDQRSIEVRGKAATVFGLHQPDGTRGVILEPGERFWIDLDNRASEPTSVHWHGQTPPPDQDGVAEFGVSVIQPAERRTYDFVPLAGTHWMHSHEGFQHQSLLSGPLIVRTDAEVRSDTQEVVIFLEDFMFADPASVMAKLEKGPAQAPAPSARPSPSPMKMAPSGATPAGGMKMDMSGAAAGGKMDLNDVDYDAYLANSRTLDDPEIVRVERAGRVRLRVINGASSTNFHIDLGALNGTAIAVDGDPIQPMQGRRFELAMAQRIDILIELPKSDGAWPILALREGSQDQTGVVLATSAANLARIASLAPLEAGPVGFDQEIRLSALRPLAPRPADATFMLMLGGSMQPYAWTINGKRWENRDPVQVRAGQRVALTFHNLTMMSHPMHLHGHHFQVVNVNGQPFSGARRDTVHVPPQSKVTVAFDADNPGRWLLHCHNLYHMEAGMMTEVKYVA